MKNKNIYIFNIISVFVLLFSLALPVSAARDNVVRVGWYDGIFNIFNNGRRSGYGYEYQQKLAAYTGWRYEYVYGSWDILLDKLEKGEIDLLSDVCLNDEKKKNMLFSEEAMGHENYYIFISEDNDEISLHDLSTLQGKNIAVNRNSYQSWLLYNWLENNHINANVIEVSISELEYDKLLKSGQIDAVASFSAFDKYTNCFPLVKLGTSNIYWGVNPHRPDLLQELNYAMQKILSSNEDYNNELHNKYMSSSGLERFLPEDEIVWLQKHGIIRIGYRADYLPFCALDKDNEQLKGMLLDFLHYSKENIKNYRLQFEAVPFSSTVAAIEALQRHEIDAVFPIGMSSYDAEVNNLLITDYLAKTEIYAIVRNQDSKNFSLNNPMIIAENRSNISYASMMADDFPKWSSRGFNSTLDCLKGTASGTADCVLVSNYRVHVLSDLMRKYELTQAATGRNMYFSFAVNRDNIQLYSILNRVIRTTPNSIIISSLAKNSVQNRKVTLEKFVQDNIFFVLIITFGFILIVILLVRSLYLARKTTKLNENLEQQKEQLQQERERAEAANRAKSSFLFNMSHDIRTPMNAIIGFRRLLEKHQEEPDKRIDYLQKIDESSTVLLSIINNVLEMARIEKGTMQLEESVWNIVQLHQGICDFFTEMMHEKKIKFTHKVTVEHNYIYCDVTKLREIFLNIISNSYKYTNEGGSVTVLLEELPDERKDWATFKYTVSDTGIGMSKEFLPHIYDEFSRESNTTMSKVEGTGLGMPIVKRLVGFMHGEIDVQSSQGEGTKFTIILPHRLASKAEVVSHDGIEIDPKLFAGKRLLLVEDNELNAEIATEILQEAGFIVEHAEDGEICVQLIEQKKPDYYQLILMDIQMPKMNGYEATRVIRAMENPLKANLPIIAMTANAFAEDKRESFKAGMNDHVAKPINIGELLSAIAKYIN